MTLPLFILVPLVGAVAAWSMGRRGARVVALVTLLVLLAILLGVLQAVAAAGGVFRAHWFIETDLSWIPTFGVRLHLVLDGLSLVLTLLTAVVGIVAVAASWSEITRRTGFFYFNLLLSLAGVMGVFLAFDLFLFYVFWELMLIPMYFLIGIWGHEERVRAAYKFFIFTQAGGLLMLLSILGLAIAHYQQTGLLTFDRQALLGTALPQVFGFWLMLGFFVGFGVKLPVVGLHTWLPDAHTQAPTAGSVILAGLLLKTGAYGMIRFAIPLFPAQSHAFAPVALGLGVAGILYGAVLALGQTDLKRLVAYTSVSHLGFVLVGIYSFDPAGRDGAVMLIICHALSTGGLFMLVGMLQERLHTRELPKLGGLSTVLPRAGALGGVLTMAGLGLPGLGNFVGELLVFLGAYRQSTLAAVGIAVGIVVATTYSLRLLCNTFYGKRQGGLETELRDLGWRETGTLLGMTALLFWLGIYPAPTLATSRNLVPPDEAGAAAAGTWGRR